MALENEYLGEDNNVMTDYKLRIGQIIVGRTRGGWGFGKARIEAVGSDPVEGEVFYTAVVLEATENMKVGQSITAYQRDVTLYREAVVVQPVNATLPFQPTKIEGFVQGSTVNGVLTSIRANGKVWSIRALAEAVLRKMQPVGTVMKEYFPLARRAEAAVAWLGNERHNPGQPLHWARGKSDDHLDCAGRHLSESDDWDVTVLPDGRAFAVLHAAQHAWRASALAQIAAEKYGGVVIVQLEVPQGGETR